MGTHGWKLTHNNSESGSQDRKIESKKIQDIMNKEEEIGLENNTYACYQELSDKAVNTKLELLEFLINEKMQGRKVVAYGAAAKGNTLLNYAAVKSDLIEAVYDKAKSKHNKFLPGSCIPILKLIYLRTKMNVQLLYCRGI